MLLKEPFVNSTILNILILVVKYKTGGTANLDIKVSNFAHPEVASVNGT